MPVLWGRIAYGLGSVYWGLGEFELALDWNRQALAALQGTQGRYAWEAEHNVAVALMDLDRWEDAYAMMQRLLHQFREIGDLRSQAEVMQDLMKYCRHKEDLDQAEDLGWQAIDILTDADANHLRGRLYRELGNIYAARGHNERARELLQISYELLHYVRATGEVMKTLEAIEALSRA